MLVGVPVPVPMPAVMLSMLPTANTATANSWRQQRTGLAHDACIMLAGCTCGVRHPSSFGLCEDLEACCPMRGAVPHYLLFHLLIAMNLSKTINFPFCAGAKKEMGWISK